MHLISPQPDDLESVLVMLPIVAQHVARYRWKKMHTSMATLALQTFTLFKKTPTYNRLAANSTVESRVGHHKLNDLEIAGYRVILQQCYTERPAMLITWTSNEGQTKELMHFYPAMGLSKQHEAQQMLLGRMQGLEISSCLVTAAQRMWGLSLPTLRNVSNVDRFYTAAIDFMQSRGEVSISTENLEGDSQTLLTALTRQAPEHIRNIVYNFPW